MKFLTCEPYLDSNIEKKREYTDESDQFFSNPQLWYAKNKKEIEDVSYLVIFANLHKQIIKMEVEFDPNKVENPKTIRDFLIDRLECETFFNSIVQPTERTDKLILVCSKSP